MEKQHNVVVELPLHLITIDMKKQIEKMIRKSGILVAAHHGVL